MQAVINVFSRNTILAHSIFLSMVGCCWRCFFGCRSFCGAGRGADDFAEGFEEIVRHFLRGRVDQARTDLRELAADLSIHLVFEQCAAIGFGKRNFRATLGKSGSATFTLRH